ncbi:hypothetical protein [Caloramator proteoclasticus]|uniref:Uncharacterized protein n=1 Tax=Caloramator proteoclasticus DSM 10124 TaxID=1121262 RepID=A0A1M4UL55_9CLOT|nr:hypothetical protein [Caloramator proteoclasticus]SHE57407.1 hypothetical protein SAMN02746091_00681 [Caloramator proteoclasticus DSM 10124]
MKYFKVFVITTIIAVTVLSILYLNKIAKRVQEYTFAGGDSFNIVLYTTSDNRFSDGSIKELLDYIETSQNGLGVKFINLGYVGDKKTLERKIDSITKGNGRHIILEICVNDKMVNKDTILLRVEKNENYDSNINYANKIRDILNKDRVNILGESKCYVQEFGDKALRVEISSKNTINDAKKLIDKVMYAIYKTITDGEI